MRPDALCGLLAEPERLAAFAAVVLGAGTPDEVAKQAGLSARDVAGALRRLAGAGLVGTAEGRLVADATVFKEAVREYAARSGGVGSEPLDPDREKAAVLRNFVRDGRLVQVPAARGKRRTVLEHIAACFEPGVRYPEREVDAALRAWHPDHAALRRYLVDEQFLAREHGLYWRVGGPVEV